MKLHLLQFSLLAAIVEDGKKWLQSLLNVYGLKTVLEDYDCVVAWDEA